MDALPGSAQICSCHDVSKDDLCQAVADGNTNIGALKAKDYAFVLEDIRKIVEAAGATPVKVILETSNLTHEEKIIGSALSKAAGAAFVKTSTGFGSGGATAEDVALMLQSFEGSARDLIDLLEEIVIGWRTAQSPTPIIPHSSGRALS